MQMMLKENSLAEELRKLEDESYMSYYNAGKCDGENKAP
jgi:hypothetical protein